MIAVTECYYGFENLASIVIADHERPALYAEAFVLLLVIRRSAEAPIQIQNAPAKSLYSSLSSGELCICMHAVGG